ncbi:MAG: hypothetical protein AAF846_20805 [Chloroflexota bacterium]
MKNFKNITTSDILAGLFLGILGFIIVLVIISLMRYEFRAVVLGLVTSGIAIALFFGIIWMIIALDHSVKSVYTDSEDNINGSTRPTDLPLFSARLPFIRHRLEKNPIRNEAKLIIDGEVSLGKFTFTGEEIRWLGDRQGRGEVILDIQKDGYWYILTIDAGSKADNLLSALQTIVPDEINTARSLRRPNFRSETISGYVNQQNLQGQWQRLETITLTITPLYLVVQTDGSVLDVIRISRIQNVLCIEHPMSLEKNVQLLTFQTEIGEQFAFEITDASFKNRLSTAIGDAVDDDPQRKKKKKESHL